MRHPHSSRRFRRPPRTCRCPPSCCPHPCPHRGRRAPVLGAAGPAAARGTGRVAGARGLPLPAEGSGAGAQEDAGGAAGLPGREWGWGSLGVGRWAGSHRPAGPGHQGGSPLSSTQWGLGELQHGQGSALCAQTPTLHQALGWGLGRSGSSVAPPWWLLRPLPPAGPEAVPGGCRCTRHALCLAHRGPLRGWQLLVVGAFRLGGYAEGPGPAARRSPLSLQPTAQGAFLRGSGLSLASGRFTAPATAIFQFSASLHVGERGRPGACGAGLASPGSHCRGASGRNLGACRGPGRGSSPTSPTRSRSGVCRAVCPAGPSPSPPLPESRCSQLSPQTAGGCRAGHHPGHGAQCGCSCASSPCVTATREWALLGATADVGSGRLSCPWRGEGLPQTQRTVLGTGVGPRPVGQLCPHPRHCVQVPGGHLGPGRQWPGLDGAGAGAAPAAGEAGRAGGGGRRGPASPSLGVDSAQPSRWTDGGHRAPQNPGAPHGRGWRPPAGASWPSGW